MKNKIIFLDFDNTILQGESVDYINTKENLSEITNDAMKGNIDYYYSLVNKAKLLKGEKLVNLKQIVYNLKYNTNIKQFIEWCHDNNFYVIVLSGGFDFILKYAQHYLKYDMFLSNYLRTNNGILTGEMNGPIMEKTSKGYYVEKYQQLLNIKADNCVAVGDGANDISMFKKVRYSISFCGNQIVNENASFHINKPDFELVKEIVKNIYFYNN